MSLEYHPSISSIMNGGTWDGVDELLFVESNQKQRGPRVVVLNNKEARTKLSSHLLLYLS